MQVVRPDAAHDPCASLRRPAGAARTRAVVPVVIAPFAIGLAAVLGVVVGLAPLVVLALTGGVAVGGALVAHRTVSSVLAGVLLRLARPYAPGERLRLFVPELDRVVDAEIVRIGFVTSTLCTGAGVVVVPNRRLLRP